ncbi:MAG: hypothetical protein JJT76_19955 [Clostridiaceae bacterium]|nr:hypothetical protein [Clostridiaceae bacterium]
MRLSEVIKKIQERNKKVSSLTGNYNEYEPLEIIHKDIDWTTDFHSCNYDALSIQARLK